MPLQLLSKDLVRLTRDPWPALLFLAGLLMLTALLVTGFRTCAGGLLEHLDEGFLGTLLAIELQAQGLDVLSEDNHHSARRAGRIRHPRIGGGHPTAAVLTHVPGWPGQAGGRGCSAGAVVE